MKLDILAIVAHPDDVELSCGGTLISHAKKGLKTGIVDLTRGEMGTRGTPEQRIEEAAEAGKRLLLSVRDNLEFRDAFFENDNEHQLEVIRKIRQYRPEIVITNAPYDRHPDHGRAAKLVEEACFKSGLIKIETEMDGQQQEAWRPKKMYNCIQSLSLEPDFFVDITDSMDEKMEAIRAFRSQFYDPKSEEPETYISSPEFMKMLESRAQEYGHRIGVKYAEGFKFNQFLGVRSLFDLI
jgi:bacillithiol biosynthesis deacetylase BshB1